MFILYNFVKQAVLGLHIYFKLTVSPFYFPDDRVKILGVMRQIIHTLHRTTLLSSDKKHFSKHLQSLTPLVCEHHKEQIMFFYSFISCD